MKCAPKSGSKKMMKGGAVKNMMAGGMSKVAAGKKPDGAGMAMGRAKARGMGAATKGGNFRA